MNEPILRVVGGAPTAEELAALTAVVAAAGNDADPPPPPPAVRRGGWSDPAHQHGAPLLPGRNGWRAAAARH